MIITRKGWIWICIWFLLFSSILATAIPEESKDNNIIYTPSTTTWIKEDGRETIVLWSGIRNVYEDGKYKPREKAKSFKEDSNINCNVIFDGYNLAECSDYNETSRTIKFSITESRWDMFWEAPTSASFETPLKKYHLEFNKTSERFEKIYSKEFEKTVGFEWYNKEKEYTIKVNSNEVIEFGEFSTEIILRENGTENLEDGNVFNHTGNADRSTGSLVSMEITAKSTRVQRGYIKFNISAIPDDQLIEEAYLSLWSYGSENREIQVYHVYDKSWVEGADGTPVYYPNLTFNSQPCGKNWDNSSSCNVSDYEDAFNMSYRVEGSDGLQFDWDVKHAVERDYDDGDVNVSFAIRQEFENDPATMWTCRFRTKEYANATQWPFLNITYIPSNLAPIVNNQFPLNSTTQYLDSANFTYNVTDPNADDIANCSLFINGIEIETDTSITKAVNQTFNRTSLSVGQHLWKIGCYDEHHLQGNSSEYNLTIIIDSPRVYNVFPANSTQSYSPYVNFTYNVTTLTHSITSCDLFINNILNETDNSITEDIKQTFNLTTLPYGDSIWLIQCTSSEGYKANSSAWNYSREIAYPIVRNQFPANSTQSYSPNVNFTFNTTIDYGTVDRCFLWLNDVLNATKSSITEIVNQTFNLTTLPYQDNIWKVECKSNLGIRYNSTSFNYSRQIAYPAITHVSPPNNTNKYTPNENFTYQVTIPYGSISSCNLWLNTISTNASDDNIEEGVDQTFNTTLPFDDTLWKIECLSDLKIRANLSEYNRSRKRAYPIVNLQFPKEAHVYSTYNVNLTYNTSVPYGSISSCFLWLNDVPLGEDTTITKIVNQTFNLTLPVLHYYNWSVQCNSNYGISTKTPVWNFTKNIPPTVPTILSPVNNTFTIVNSQILGCSGSTDPEDDVNYEFYGGTSTSSLSLLQNSSLTTYNWTGLTLKDHYWRCRANDNLSHSSWTGIRKLTYTQIYANCIGANSTVAIAFNFSFAEETNLTKLYNVSFESTFTLWGTNQSINYTINTDLTIVNETLFCISPVNATFYGNAMIEYVKGTYDIRNYYLRNVTLNDTTKHTVLYSLPITLATGIGITITDEIDDPLPEVYITIQRYYVGEDTYRTIAMGKTDDVGKDYIYLRKYDAWYQFIMEKEGVVLFTSDKMKISANTLSLKIGETIISDLLESFDDVIYNLSYNNVTKVFSAIWVDTAGNVKKGCLSVVDRHPSGDTWVCHDCTSAASGTLTCDASTYATGNHTLIATFYINMNPLYTLATRVISSYSGRLYDLIGLDGVVVTLFITGTAAFAALWWSPAAVIILGIIGFISSIWLQAINVTYGAALAIIIAGIIIMVQQSKGKS